MNSHAEYYDALHCDAVYAKVIRALYGEQANRWSITAAQEAAPEVAAALAGKLAADARWVAAYRAERGRS